MNNVLQSIKKSIAYWLLFLAPALSLACSQGTLSPEVVVIGGGTGGINVGIAAARPGAETLIIEKTEWLGGMLTSAGVSAVDGNYRLPGGIWGEFKDSLVSHYGSEEALKTGWVSNVLF